MKFKTVRQNAACKHTNTNLNPFHLVYQIVLYFKKSHIKYNKAPQNSLCEALKNQLIHRKQCRLNQ